MLTFLKLDINVFDDPKIVFLLSHEDGSDFFVLWIGILTLAMKSPNPGFLMVTESMPHNAGSIASMLKIKKSVVERGLQFFVEFNMIEIVDDKLIFVCNFQKHQKLDKIEQERINSKKRMRRYREKQRRLINGKK